MKLNTKLAVLAGMACVLAGVVVSHAADEGTLVRMKDGVCKFTVLDSRGVTPLKDLDLALTSPVDGTPILAGKTDLSGACALTVPAGRYIVRVRDMDLAILEASSEQSIVECRIVLPDEPMAVGGQDETAAPATEEGSSKKGAFWTAGGMQAFVVGTAVVLAVGGGGYLIYDEIDDDDDDDSSSTPPVPTTTTRRSRASTPSLSN